MGYITPIYSMARQSNNQAQPIAAIPLPSADLVQYRFDQLDGTVKALDTKLERLITVGITKADVIAMSAANDKRVSELETKVEGMMTDMDKVKGAISLLRVFSIIITLIAAIIGSLWWLKR